MIPAGLKTLFWDTDVETLVPEDYPDYVIFRILEYGDEAAVRWLRETFPEGEIRRLIQSERRLSEKSANYWALMYGIRRADVAALSENRQESELHSFRGRP